MANKRILKKEINYVAGELNVCVINILYRALMPKK